MADLLPPDLTEEQKRNMAAQGIGTFTPRGKPPKKAPPPPPPPTNNELAIQGNQAEVLRRRERLQGADY